MYPFWSLCVEIFQNKTVYAQLMSVNFESLVYFDVRNVEKEHFFPLMSVIVLRKPNYGTEKWPKRELYCRNNKKINFKLVTLFEKVLMKIQPCVHSSELKPALASVFQ